MYCMRRKNVFIRAALILLVLVIIMGVALTDQAEIVAFNAWLHDNRFSWLGWRLAVYATLGWGMWKIRQAPGFRDEYRQSLRRITVVSILFILLCEYALFSHTGG